IQIMAGVPARRDAGIDAGHGSRVEHGGEFSRDTRGKRSRGAARAPAAGSAGITSAPIANACEPRGIAVRLVERCGGRGLSRLDPAAGHGTRCRSIHRRQDIARAALGRFSLGISPAGMALTYFDWALHLLSSPGKLAQLREKALRKAIRLGNYALRHGTDPDYPPCILPLPQDRRFAGEAWRRWPFNLIYQGFLLNQQWWHSATTGIGGVSRHHEQMVSFASRQWL